jgi:hypothetical protein
MKYELSVGVIPENLNLLNSFIEFSNTIEKTL